MEVFKISELSKLVGKGKKVKIGDIEIEVKPLSVSDMDLMMDLSKEGPEQIKAMKTLINKVLKQAVPDTTDEEIKNIAIEHIMKIMEAIMEVNQLEEIKDKDFMKKIKEKQSGRHTPESGNKERAKS